jgi:hypothetical protein
MFDSRRKCLTEEVGAEYAMIRVQHSVPFSYFLFTVQCLKKQILLCACASACQACEAYASVCDNLCVCPRFFSARNLSLWRQCTPCVMSFSVLCLTHTCKQDAYHYSRNMILQMYHPTPVTPLDGKLHTTTGVVYPQQQHNLQQ